MFREDWSIGLDNKIGKKIDKKIARKIDKKIDKKAELELGKGNENGI